MTTITAGAMAVLVLELFKWAWRKWIAKDTEYDFPKVFYTISIPVLNILVVPLLAFIGYEGYSMPTDLLEFVRVLVMTAIGVLTTLVTYNAGLKPLKEYNK